MQRLEVSCALRRIYMSLGAKGLMGYTMAQLVEALRYRLPGDVIGNFHYHNPSDRTMALHVPNVVKSGSLNLLEPSGPVQACNGIDYLLPLSLIGVRTIMCS